MTPERLDRKALSTLAAGASDEAVRLAAEVLRDDTDNQQWRKQIGPCLTQTGVATLLGLTAPGAAKRAASGDLLRLTNGDGRPAYPLFQFSGRRVVKGLPEVIRLLARVDDELTIASWLTIAKRSLDGRTPVEALRNGDADAVYATASDYLSRST